MRQYTTEETAILEARGYKLIDGIWTKHDEAGNSRSANPQDHHNWAAADLADARANAPAEDIEAMTDLNTLDGAGKTE